MNNFKFKMASRRDHNVLGFYICFIACLFDLLLGADPIFPFKSTSKVNEITPQDHNINLIKAGQPIVYQGNLYTQFYVTNNGLVAFTTDAGNLIYHKQDWSRSDVSPFIDTPFIAPFYHNGQHLDTLQYYTGHVKYQTLSTPADRQNISSYIRSQFSGIESFNATWGILITWENVTSITQVESKSCAGTTSNPCPTNTFQLVLLTDSVESYAIFNYGGMHIPLEKYDQAGFNGGSGTGWTNVRGNNDDPTQLSRYQGSDVIGRYVFRISSGQIFRGGCTTDRTLNLINVFPSYAGMFGGKMLDISGPCFARSSRIMCRFGEPTQSQSGTQSTTGSTQIATYVDQSRVRCMVPRLMVRDRMKLSISTNGGSTYPYSTVITVVFPGRMPASEHVTMDWSDASMGWYAAEPTELTLSWKPELLSNNSYDKVDVRLVGYMEANGVSSYKPLTTLGQDIRANSGRLTINPQNYQCTGADCNYEVGLVEVVLKDNATPQSYKFLSSKAIPLGWYVQNAMRSNHGDNWPAAMCNNWYNNEKTNSEAWQKQLLSCPCNLKQALSDFGRFQPDAGCNLRNKGSKGNCFYHKESVHCVRAVHPVTGAGNQCCYNEHGVLQYAADSFQGSTPDLGHDWGAAPYGKPGYVPSLSHWLDDVVTFYYCCIWDGYNSCDKYMDLRPTRDCTGYTSPVLASVYGQGHVTTFDGFVYRMIGPGEYVLLEADNTVIQGRFMKNPYPTENNRTITSTYVLTAVSVQNIRTSDTVEISLRISDFNVNHDHQELDVRVNGELVTFNEGALAWQDFQGVAIVNTDTIRKLQSNFTVLLTNNVGFQVAEHAHGLQLDVMMPSTGFTKVSGLFGNLNGELRTRQGALFNIKRNKNTRYIYNGFELPWAVQNESQSLFQTFIPANHSFWGTINLNPTPLPGSIESRARTICGTNRECLFDYSYTRSMDIITHTKAAATRYSSLVANLQPVRSCGLLNVPRAKKEGKEYVVNTTTYLTGCRAGSLSGHDTYTCIETSNKTQEWSPAITTTCAGVTLEEADIGLIVGVCVGVGAIVLIAVIIAVVFSRKRKSQTLKRTGRAKDPEEKESMKTAV